MNIKPCCRLRAARDYMASSHRHGIAVGVNLPWPATETRTASAASLYLWPAVPGIWMTG